MVQACGTSRVNALAEYGKNDFVRLQNLIQGWRSLAASFPQTGSYADFVNHIDKSLYDNTEIEIFLRRFAKLLLAEAADSLGQGHHYTPKNGLDSLLAELRWEESDRPRLYDYVREGNCWKTICHGKDGLLCILPPDNSFLNLAMFRDEVERFHAQLETPFISGLIHVGSVLQGSIRRSGELGEFIWESEDTSSLTTDELVPLLGLFSIIKDNLFRKDAYDWPRPDGWIWPWPEDPTRTVPDRDKFCAKCKAKKQCSCFKKNVPDIPRVSVDGSRGPGVRSLGPHSAGQLLGELIGEVAPIGTFRGQWTVLLRRPDLDDAAVAEIYPKKFGNWVRNVRHNPNPSAEYKVMKLTGRWRIMLVALRNIADGEEITARFGKGYEREERYDIMEGFGRTYAHVVGLE